MIYMNEYEIYEARDLLTRDRDATPVAAAASETLASLMEYANGCSDGWAYWPKPSRAAAKLQTLVAQARLGMRGWQQGNELAAPSEQQYAEALRPVKAFRTREAKRRGEAAEALFRIYAVGERANATPPQPSSGELEPNEAAALLIGSTIRSAEYVSPEDAAPDSGYLIIRTSSATVYADAPTFYAEPKETTPCAS
jgi:hypothetical protein